ncbi:MAG: ATP-binding protein [Flavobacteriales bacterium]|jgi:serine/threonine-protein kinase RsbW|nr:ATP-binding protein [Bacteroidota bacterium]|tara:strand:+ start:39 stop:440 length:402 start_codon:yes stop_codon:yes gene_type:complete
MQELSFQSKPENIAVVERLIDEMCENHNVIEEHYGDILIAMTEGVNNAIVHGNKLDVTKSVSVEYEKRGKDLFFRITDEGAGFDYENLPDPTAPENLERPNGRGVFLMRNLADECSFEDDGRIIELVFTGVLR